MNGEALDYTLNLNAVGFTGGMGKADKSISTLTTSANALRPAMRQMGSALQWVGFSIVPQLTANLSATVGIVNSLTKAFGGARAAALAFGPAALVAGTGLLIKKGQDLIGGDFDKEAKADRLRVDRLENSRKRLQGLLNDDNIAAKLGEAKTERFEKLLRYSSGAKLDANMRYIRKQIAPFIETQDEKDAYTLRMKLTAGTLTDEKSKARFAAAEEYRQDVGEINSMTAISKAYRAELRSLAGEKYKLALDAADKVGLPNQLAPQGGHVLSGPNPTELERMGFVFNRGGFAGNDFNRETAQNTKLANTYLKQLVDKTKDNSFANQ